ncbi:MAG: class I SAM-dependent methyltransferase [SAR202 cluster bacterium]|nr:class I SAM-dependent methyltransferase [SAR202 cluster bacterium]MDP7533257.1 class I SAM-dependent methyltransferase [SAR202 cluster bacterium]
MNEWTMDRWKYFDITHRDHVLCNPTTVEKLDGLIGLLNLDRGASVLDIACGKAEMLIRMAEAYGVTGVGIDKPPFAVADAEAKRGERVPDAELEFVLGDGADYNPEAPGSFDLAACIGASWVFGDHRGTLRAVKAMVKPGGLVTAGEPYWIYEPDPEHLAAGGLSAPFFGTHVENVAIGEEESLTLLYTIVSNQDDWDRYEGLQWRAAAEYAREQPDDPDLPEILARVSKSRDIYLKWGRRDFGWAIYLFRRPE